MLAIIGSLVLIVIVWLLGRYTKIMTDDQVKFIIGSSILYIILFGAVMSLLNSNDNLMDAMMKNSTYLSLIFYILWYVTSASVTNRLTGNHDYVGFFDDSSRYISQRNVQ